jgi:hypothetical protein
LPDHRRIAHHPKVRRPTDWLLLAVIGVVASACGGTSHGSGSPRSTRPPAERRLAPPLDTRIDGVTFCGTSPFPEFPDEGASGMILYGDAGADDPYEGRMLGVLWNPADDENHAGDGEARPVTVRVVPGVAAPITVFQQVVHPDLGTVIAWTEGDHAFGLYGRLWTMDMADELVDIADALVDDQGEFRIPKEALPDGFAEVFSGSPAVASIALPSSSTYSVVYQGDDGSLLSLWGTLMTEGAFEAFRFFTTKLGREEIAGHDALVGDAWTDAGPAVVTWREPDGLVVRIVGVGASLETARAIAAGTRDLTDEEWDELVGAGLCDFS